MKSNLSSHIINDHPSVKSLETLNSIESKAITEDQNEQKDDFD